MSVLPDVLEPYLKLVVCGTGVGNKSAKLEAYYAGVGNKFWRTLAKTRLTSRQLDPLEFNDLLKDGIGLTDLAKGHVGSDDAIRASDFDVDLFVQKLKQYRPRVVAFNGKKAAETFFKAIFRRAHVGYGRQSEQLDGIVFYVCPSTSSAGNGAWDEREWKKLARFVRRVEW